MVTADLRRLDAGVPEPKLTWLMVILVDLEGFSEESGGDSLILIAGQPFQCIYKDKRGPQG